jgi:uncharacterized protein
MEFCFALPGAAAYSHTLHTRLQQRLNTLGEAYMARLAHSDHTPRFCNRLLLEDTPYLRQHAHNPVDWYPWGEEAFARAQAENKPIFLSIGYATCHWCHVMERESFENIALATQLNRDFIAIKVDRERHPAVDSIYMTALMLRSGRGGWPMSNFLTPCGQPFFNGTYYPPDNFHALLTEISAAWQQQQQQLEAQAAHLSAKLEKIMSANHSATEVDEHILKQALDEIISVYDEDNGGFGNTQKFPQEPWLMLLLDHYQRQPDRVCQRVWQHTLDALMNGGIHDHLGGGFHRYSVDPGWLVPHFEKMLYTQAQLARVYLRAWRVSGNPLYARCARLALEYVLHQQTDAEGAFYSATDADSAAVAGGKCEEGLFFVWTVAQIEAALTPQEAELALDLFGITAEGNFEGRNILHLPEALPAYAHRYGLPLEYLLQQLDKIRATLAAVRQLRPQPLCDDKIIVAWNGLFITALAEAALEWHDQNYLKAAQRAASSLWRSQWDGTRLWRIRQGQQRSVAGTLQDYAMFAQALLCLYDADPEGAWLDHAQTLVHALHRTFADPQHGGYYLSPAEDTLLIVRPKEATDDAIPAANGVTLHVLAQLAARTGKPEYRAQANALIQAFSHAIHHHPSAYASLLLALTELRQGEQGPVRYAVDGQVRIHLRPHEHDILIDFHLAQGIYINATATPDSPMGGLSLKAEGVALQWQAAPPLYSKIINAVVYQNNFTLNADFDGGVLEIHFQACTDNTCLPWQCVRFIVPPAPRV